ncbi:MAG: hypothetical protein WDO69_34205 [Pseudomonadota bacterium]
MSKSQAEVDARQRRVHAALSRQRERQLIYYELGTNQAYLLDVVHKAAQPAGRCDLIGLRA